MNRFLALLVCTTSAACFHPQNDLKGQCGSDTDCGPGARCDKTQSPPVCVASTCTPACDSGSVCDETTVTCKPVTTPSVVVTSPTANAFVGGKVQAVATARAPGGVTGVTFQVKNGAGAVIGTGAGAAASGSADFSATITLGPTGVSDGPATVSAALTYPGGTLTSDNVPVTIDVTPPVVTALQVFLAGADTPTVQGVTYPSQPPGATSLSLSGHDGSHFILTDQLHIKGTIEDSGAGISCGSLKYRIDGTDGSAVIRGVAAQTLAGCTADGSKSVNFEVPAAILNDTTKNGRLGAGVGSMQVVILASDQATGLPNIMAESPQSVDVTRLWWSRQFKVAAPATVTVSGLAIHPDTDLIVTNNTTAFTETVFSLFRDGPFHVGGGEHWKAVGGAIQGTAAIGLKVADPQIDPQIYVASNSSASTNASLRILAFNANGSSAWSSAALDTFSTPPALFPNSTINRTTGCEALIAAGPKFLYGACQDAPNSISGTSVSALVTNVTSENISDSPVTVGGSNIFVGTNQNIVQASFQQVGGNGIMVAGMRFSTSPPAAFTGPLATPNGSVIVASVGDRKIYAKQYTTELGFSPVFSSNDLTSSPSGMPIFSSATTLLFNTANAKLHRMTTDGVDSVLASLPTAGGTPLLGHDGVAYVGRSGGVSAIDASGTASWNFSISAGVGVPPTLDCTGTLYVAVADTVYALVTDMMGDPSNAGLADTPWPKFQRDSRNTGNADITTKFGVRTAPGPGGCIQ